MRVVIVGGGIAGLTLANALEKADIDYVLLERRGLFDPQVGASIGLSPASIRTLDQVGAAQEILDATKSIKRGRHHRADGSLIMPPDENFPLLERRFGYGLCFLDRQIVLRALYNAIEEKERCLLNKRVREIEHLELGVKVHCEDGTTYAGDVVLGCDGVNSKVRDEMWRIASQVDPTYFSQKERERMTAEYTCLFGISHPLPGMEEGDVDHVYDKGHAMLVIHGKGGRIYWFYFQRLRKPVHFHSDSFPKYTAKDAEDMAEKEGWRPYHDKYKLKDLWRNRITYTLVAMEEALFENWSYGRIATMGDSTHKMTANQGSGGNAAVESVAAMANELKRLQETSSSPSAPVSAKEVRTAFAAWKAKRKNRINSTWKDAAKFCRMQGLESLGDIITVFYILPNAANYITAIYTKSLIGAEVLEYLSLPERSFRGTAPFNPKQGTGQEESTVVRWLFTVPLLGMAYFGYQNTATQDTSLVQPFSTLFDPSSSQASWLQSFSLQLTTAVMYSIWLIESNRRANTLTPVQFSIAFASLSNIFGPGFIAPIFYAFHYLSSPIEIFAPSDMRLTNVAYTRTVLPMMLLHTLVPLTLRLTNVSIPMDKTACWWNLLLAPFLVGTLQHLLVRTNVSTANIYQDALHDQKKDLPAITRTLYTLTALSTLGWWSTFPTLHAAEASLLLPTAVWLALLFTDLKSAGMLRRSWLTIISAGVVVSVICGPTTALGLGWLWREKVLANERHKNALTRERYGGGKTVWEVEGTGPVGFGKKVGVDGSVDGEVEVNGHAIGGLNGHLNGSAK
ncbi:hypothetical protein M409DRAFT_68702 [Zasmidium cellare ATCC 36951]|uniref:FAD-binding domain-containing protein n=1 Tax=Zasmidium cellare ATCC 36951 TaxID=1080233 RepID=A0A6A6CC88_ZASCE|nr:uncharacterized protein M409DRAFT_68702 [Zasmidium cellare ATCC 36951]KAF2163066.1 hypothetical protein M409DRAFT_68702 [Zasmidium cellare ATCC 36951]